MNGTASPSVFVVFGITGDLATRKLLPALYQLVKNNLLHKDTIIIGTSRRALSVDRVLNTVELCVLKDNNVCDPVVMQKLHRALSVVQLDPAKPEDFAVLENTITQQETIAGPLTRLYYLSVPPSAYQQIITNLPNPKNRTCRLLVEKPFGYDLTSAEQLIAETSTYFSEEQIFRIDHYLAKETAQNILTFRQCNPLFRTIWNDQHIIAIAIHVYEQIDIEGRAAFYEPTGALRDFVQSHLLQILALTTLENPSTINKIAELHRAKLAIVQNLSVVMDDPTQPIIRAQYQGYLAEVHNETSRTETFACIPLRIDTDQWRGTRMLVATGKALDKKCSEIVITFADPKNPVDTNTLTFRIYPEEAITLSLYAKRPGYEHKTETVHMNFDYHHTFGRGNHPDAYERVLVDAVKGDRTLFTSSDEVIASWQALAPLQEAWQQDTAPLQTYAKGSTAEDIIVANAQLKIQG